MSNSITPRLVSRVFFGSFRAISATAKRGGLFVSNYERGRKDVRGEGRVWEGYHRIWLYTWGAH